VAVSVVGHNRPERPKEKLFSVVQNYRRAIVNVATLLVTIVALLLVFEGILRLWPAELLGQEFANGVLNRYTATPSGIYYHDPSLRMNFMKPNFTTENYLNGYRWHHQTDGLGFRNPQTRTQADVLLLGDSLIYGHGVNIDETVGILLERSGPYSVVNLGTQGYCAYQEAYLVTEYVPKFKPRYVFLFFFENDITDVYAWRTDQEIHEFIQKDIADITFKARTDPTRLMKRRPFLPSPLYVSRAFDMLKFKLRFKREKNQPPAVIDKLHDANDEESLAWRYTKQAILYMDAVAKSHHAKFVVVPIIMAQKPYYDILKRFAAHHGLLFAEKSEVYNWPPTHFLPGDGHFTGEGANAMAELVTDYLK
jgi:hypothetical protein